MELIIDMNEIIDWVSDNYIWFIAVFYVKAMFPAWRGVARYIYTNDEFHGKKIEATVLGFVTSLVWPMVLLVWTVNKIGSHFLNDLDEEKETITFHVGQKVRYKITGKEYVIEHVYNSIRRIFVVNYDKYDFISESMDLFEHVEEDRYHPIDAGWDLINKVAEERNTNWHENTKKPYLFQVGDIVNYYDDSKTMGLVIQINREDHPYLVKWNDGEDLHSKCAVDELVLVKRSVNIDELWDKLLAYEESQTETVFEDPDDDDDYQETEQEIKEAIVEDENEIPTCVDDDEDNEQCGGSDNNEDENEEICGGSEEEIPSPKFKVGDIVRFKFENHEDYNKISKIYDVVGVIKDGQILYYRYKVMGMVIEWVHENCFERVSPKHLFNVGDTIVSMLTNNEQALGIVLANHPNNYFNVKFMDDSVGIHCALNYQKYSGPEIKFKKGDKFRVGSTILAVKSAYVVDDVLTYYMDNDIKLPYNEIEKCNFLNPRQ